VTDAPPGQISGHDLAETVEAALRRAGAPLVDLAPLGQARAALETELSEVLAERTSDEWAARYIRNVPVDGATPADYLLRDVDLGQDGRCLALIHFYAGGVEHPFVGLHARTGMLRDAGAVGRVVARLTECFEVFAPRSVRFWQVAGGPEPRLDALGVGATPDLHLVAGALDSLARAGPPSTPLTFTRLAPEHLDAAAARCAAWYAALPVTEPTLRASLNPTSSEAFAHCLDTGAELDGETVGYVAAAAARRHGVVGYEVYEEVLCPAARGRGFGPHLQRALVVALADRVHDHPAPALLGTIHHANAASLATARRTGRRRIGTDFFVPTRFASARSGASAVAG
jgi:GNAT superfamily N-acetyltransferase